MPSRSSKKKPSALLLPATSLDQIMEVDGDIFVRWAYITMLGRPADAEGLAFYLRRMTEGKSKVSVLKQLSRSAEGRGHGVRLAGLDGAIRRAMLARAPIIGPVFQRMQRNGTSQASQAR